MKKQYYILIRLLPYAFILFLVFPFLNGYLQFVTPEENRENRLLAEKPEFNIALLDPFPIKYTAYFDDHFPFRSKYIYYNDRLNLQVFNQIYLKQDIIIGEDSWLYRKDDFLPSIAKNKRYTEDELLSIANEIRRRIDFFNKKNITYLLVVVPVKASVYPENLPEMLQNPDEAKYVHKTELLIDFLTEQNLMNHVLELKPEIIKHKKDFQLFLKCDHHWNELGGFHASKEILNKLNQHNEKVFNKFDLHDFDLTFESNTKGNLSRHFSIEGICIDKVPTLKSSSPSSIIYKGKQRAYKAPEKFMYKWAYQIVKTTKHKNRPKLLAIRDSFADALIPYLSLGFHESVYIWDDWKYRLNEEIVSKENPNVVLNIIVETNMLRLVEYSGQ